MKKQHRHETADVTVGDEGEIARDGDIAQAAHRAHPERSENEGGGEIADCVRLHLVTRPRNPRRPPTSGTLASLTKIGKRVLRSPPAASHGRDRRACLRM